VAKMKRYDPSKRKPDENIVVHGERREFVTNPAGESFSHVEPQHIPEGFYPAAAFLLAQLPPNLFSRVSAAPDGEIHGFRCIGCDEIVMRPSQMREHRDMHRAQVSALRKAGKDRAATRQKRDTSHLESVEGKDAEKLATALRDEGASYQQIADEFKRRGVKTKTGKEVWSTTQVMRLLKP
jgi:hypothetical protein